MRPQFQLTFARPFGGIRIEGDLDLSADDGVMAAFKSLEVCGVTRIQADFGGVTFIDAHTLGLLRGIQRRLTARHGYVEVVAASDWYVRVCRLAHYDTLLPTGSPVRRQAIIATPPAADRAAAGS